MWKKYFSQGLFYEEMEFLGGILSARISYWNWKKDTRINITENFGWYFKQRYLFDNMDTDRVLLCFTTGVLHRLVSITSYSLDFSSSFVVLEIKLLSKHHKRRNFFTPQGVFWVFMFIYYWNIEISCSLVGKFAFLFFLCVNISPLIYTFHFHHTFCFVLPYSFAYLDWINSLSYGTPSMCISQILINLK